MLYNRNKNSLTGGESVVKKFCLMVVVMIVFASAGAYAGSPDAIIGDWFTAGEISVVQVYKCGDLYCGKITWLKNPKNEQGEDKVDLKPG